MAFETPAAAARRWLRLLNRRRLQRRKAARAIDYTQWCAAHDALDAPALVALQDRLRALNGRLTATLLLPLAGADVAALQTTLASLQSQLYRQWQLKLDPASAAAGAVAWAAGAAAAEPRVSLADGAEAAEAADWIVHARAGDHWRPHALLLFAEALQARPSARLMYADHDAVDAKGARHDPVFKCDWNPLLLLSHDYIGPPALWRGPQLRHRVGPGAGPHARVLLGTAGLDAADVLHIPHVLLHQPAHAPRIHADPQAVSEHLLQAGVVARADATPHGVRVHLTLPEPAPLVSVIVPTRNGLRLLRNCVRGLLDGTDYPALELVVVDNGSDDPACLAYLRQIAADTRVRILRDDGPFNYAALNNAAVAGCRGSVVALLNNDIEVVDSGWLRELVSLALLPGSGAVGARLLYGDGTLQHAGVVVGIGGDAGHVFRHMRAGAGGAPGVAMQLRSYSAVTAACMVVRKHHYMAVGGLDAQYFPIAFNDIDFCLRLQQHGLRNVYTPHAALLHHESVSRGSDRSAARRLHFAAEQAAFRQRWQRVIQRDPSYNPNLTLADENAGLAVPPRVSPLQRWQPDTDA